VAVLLLLEPLALAGHLVLVVLALLHLFQEHL
jgi:hypothetical protein